MASVTPSRPRIWIRPEDLVGLKARCTPDNDRWTAFQFMVDTHMSGGWDVGVVSFAFAYLIKGGMDYANAAMALCDLWVAGGVDAISGDSYLKTREILYAMAVAYDWLRPALGPRQPVWKAAMEQWANAVWPETNPARAGAWAVANPGSNYWWAFETTWMIGLALSGDSTQAPAIVNLARSKWDNAAVPFFNGLGKGGYLLEGTTYSANSLRYVVWILEAVRTATGEDLLASTPWIKDAITAKIHLTVPRMDLKVPLGDQTQGSFGPLSDVDRSPMLIATRFDPRAAPWLDSIQPARMQARANLWEEVAFFTPPMPLGGDPE